MVLLSKMFCGVFCFVGKKPTTMLQTEVCQKCTPQGHFCSTSKIKTVLNIISLVIYYSNGLSLNHNQIVCRNQMKYFHNEMVHCLLIK